MPQSEADLKRIIKEAMSETLTKYGFDSDKPTYMQQDLAFLRKMRLRSESVSHNILKSGIAVMVTGFLFFIWNAVQDVFRN